MGLDGVCRKIDNLEDVIFFIALELPSLYIKRHPLELLSALWFFNKSPLPFFIRS
jgi:hypothetical protein